MPSDSRSEMSVRHHSVQCLYHVHTEDSILSFTLNSEVLTESSRGVLEGFSIWPITEGKLTEQSGEPIKTQSEYMQTLQNAGKRVRTSHDWFYL